MLRTPATIPPFMILILSVPPIAATREEAVVSSLRPSHRSASRLETEIEIDVWPPQTSFRFGPFQAYQRTHRDFI